MAAVIAAWLGLPSLALCAVLVLFYGASAVTVVWLCHFRPVGPHTKTFSGVVAPFFGSVSILFALLTGFLANDIGERNRHAARTMLAEADGLRTTLTLSIASASDMAGIRAALKTYMTSVLNDEWPHMVDRGGAVATDNAVADLLREVSDPKIATEAGQAVHSALLNAVIRVRSARSDRLEISLDHTNDIKWIMVLILGIITQAAIGLVHLDRKRPQAAALAVFSVAVVVALTLVALQEQPFDGLLQVSPEPIAHVLKTLNSG
jgi:RsiW-degrading membrane proteinase PrsW (M82 family)